MLVVIVPIVIVIVVLIVPLLVEVVVVVLVLVELLFRLTELAFARVVHEGRRRVPAVGVGVAALGLATVEGLAEVLLETHAFEGVVHFQVTNI